MRQVTHALLTRPPLNCESLGFITVPFDLHVLGTPPAFILSQDQTLMFKFLIVQNSLTVRCSRSVSHLRYSLRCSVYCFWVRFFRIVCSNCRYFNLLRPPLPAGSCGTRLPVLTNENFIRIFKVVSLFDYQGSLLFWKK
jgi:hypothetical protein